MLQLNSFSYGDVDSFDAFGITCDRETHFILPEQRKYTQEVPGLDGVIDFGIGGYGVRIMPVDVYYYGDYANLRANREQVIAWLANISGQAKKLAFSDDSTRYYMAKCYPAINFSNTSDHKIGTIQFECNPPWCYINGVLQTPEEIIWQTCSKDGNQYTQEFSTSGHMRFTNIGTMSVKPVIKLIGRVQAGTILTYNGATWSYGASLLYDGIKIDCAAETVTRMSDGANLFPSVSGSYFQFQPGQINIDISMPSTMTWPNDMTVIVEFTPQNMG